MELPQDYNPSLFQQTQNTLYANHFKFEIDRLSDLSFFVQSVSIPSVEAKRAEQATPFVTVFQPGDHLRYGTFEVSYLVDAKFKNYFSLYYWMKGYGFPHDFDEVVRFREKQQTLVGNVRATPANLERTHAVLSVLLPDTSAIVAEILIEDVFPIALNPVEFRTTDTDQLILRTNCTFSCSSFDLRTYF